MNTVYLKKLQENATIPTRGSEHAAGYDLYAAEDFTLMPLDRHLFKTGIAIAIPQGCYGRIAPRSGLAFKDGIDVMAGVIDEDYRGELGVLLVNLGKNEKVIKMGEKIAQIIIENYNKVSFSEVDDLTQTQRGEGGFGSTDKNIIPITKKSADVIATTTIEKTEIAVKDHKTSTSPLLEKYRGSAADVPKPTANYETAIKERERQIP